jgi:hypothetical protein
VSPTHGTAFSGRDRGAFGCIVTFENAAGDTLSGHRPGKPLAALTQLCDAALELDPSFRVVSYSTPETILTDLRGRQVRDMRTAERGGGSIPEPFACGMAKRREMLHPRLRGGSRSADLLYDGSS